MKSCPTLGSALLPDPAQRGPVASAPRRPKRAARLDDLVEGFPIVTQVDGVPIALIRLGDRVHALDNRCPHQGGPLAYGLVDGEGIICPWHRLRFDLQTGESLNWRFGTARVYPVVIKDGDVLVSVG